MNDDRPDLEPEASKLHQKMRKLSPDSQSDIRTSHSFATRPDRHCIKKNIPED